MQDGQLLAQYARDGSEAAFARIVARHRALVYGTCLRATDSPPLAEDATQVVFLLLARKAGTLRAGPSLAGWLYQTARFVAKDVRKQEARRQRREGVVLEELAPRPAPPAPEWQRIEPLLNGALSALRPAERALILLRFLEGLSLSETGAALGLSEDAARMRVSRAVEKMRRHLASHGASVTGVVLTGLLTSEATRPVPARTAQALPSSNVLLLLKGVSHTMKIVKAKVAALAAAALLAGATAPRLAHALVPEKGPQEAIVQASHSPATAPPIALKNTVQFTLDKGQQTAYSLSLPRGAFFVVLDVRRADGEWGSGSERAEASISLVDVKGQPFPHGVVDEDGIGVSFVQPQNRVVFHPTLTTPESLTLNIGNRGVRCRYWLTVLPAPTSLASPALAVPLFGETVPGPMRLGEARTGRLAKNGYRYFAVPLKAGDYQASLEFRGTGTPAASLNGYLFLDDENGLTTDGSNFAKGITQLHDDTGTAPPYRETAPFSLKRDGVYLLTLSNQGEDAPGSNVGAVNFSVTITPAAPAATAPRPKRN